jgi:hypothetical protein
LRKRPGGSAPNRDFSLSVLKIDFLGVLYFFRLKIEVKRKPPLPCKYSEKCAKRRDFLFKGSIMIEITHIRALGRISLLVVARRQPENAAFSSEHQCSLGGRGHFFGSDIEILCLRQN